MGDKTHIEWTDATWNPVSGCTKVSEGCRHCYIDRTPPFRMAGRRFDGPGIGASTGVMLHPERMDQPLVCSMADLFHADVPDEYIARVWAVMAASPQHTFQCLTKRPARMRSMLSNPLWWQYEFARACDDLGVDYASAVAWSRPDVGYLRNVWLGVSTEDQATADLRIPILLDTPAAVRWISAEPLLGPIDLDEGRCDQHSRHEVVRDDRGEERCGECLADGWSGELSHGHWLDPLNGGIGWVVTGGESGPRARPMHPDWARSLRDQCAQAGVPYLHKQWGEWAPAEWKPARLPGEDVEAYKARAEAIGATHAFPGTCYMEGGKVVHTFLQLDHKPWSAERGPDAPAPAVGMRKVGKKASGRELDGRTHDEYPGGEA